jgi:sucrose-phosphate synthase
MTVDRMFTSDIDNTLLGDRKSLKQLIQRLKKYRDVAGFGIATGRWLESAVKVSKKWSVPMPDVLITAVGTEIHYGPKLIRGKGWDQHINYRWKPKELRRLMDTLPGLVLQPTSEQREFKISYDIVDAHKAPKIPEIRRRLSREGLRTNLIYSHQKHVHLLPIRASKGFARRYFVGKWDIPLDNVLVAGDSGNAVDMLRGRLLGIVLGNHHPELKALARFEWIYFVNGHYAAGYWRGWITMISSSAAASVRRKVLRP